MNKTLILMLLFIFTGCATSGLPTFTTDVPENISSATHKMTNIFLEGSYVVLNDEWSITAAHNKPILLMTGRKAIYHQACDVALIKTRFGNTAHTKLGYLYKGNSAYLSGYPLFYMPLAYNKVTYLGDIKTKWLGKKCQYSFVRGALISGMSGGGVWNDKGELVGINIGIGTYNGETTVAFLSINYISNWIYQNTGIKLDIAP